MSLFTTIALGGIIGWVATILMKTEAQTGILASVVVGIFGSLLGTGIARTLGVPVQSAAANGIVAILGAAGPIAILRSLGFFSKSPAWR
jgi:uncharacterized membrane protein YeaQ/YmgE (transglycosylase-associated protein family)